MWSPWPILIQDAGNNLEKQGNVFADILVAVTAVMGSKADFIAPALWHDARNLIYNLDDIVFEEWQNGVKEGVDKHDWARLASHRTFSTVLYLEVWFISS